MTRTMIQGEMRILVMSISLRNDAIRDARIVRMLSCTTGFSSFLRLTFKKQVAISKDRTVAAHKHESIYKTDLLLGNGSFFSGKPEHQAVNYCLIQLFRDTCNNFKIAR